MSSFADKLDEMSPERRLYMLQTLPTHLSRARHKDRLVQVLTTFDFLQTKVVTMDPQGLIEDYALVPEAGVEGERARSLSLVQDALRLSAHVLGRDSSQLPSQLTGRLLGFAESEIQGLLEQARSKTPEPWLRPLTPSLTAPGGPLIRTLVGSTTPVKSLAISADSRHAVSGYFDHTIKVWDLETGAELRSFKGHTAMVSAVAVNQDCRFVVSGCDDGYVKVWDPERGVAIWTFDTEDVEGVTAVTITSDGRYAASGTRMGKIHVWDLESGKTISRMHHSGPINSSLDHISLRQDSQHLTSVLYDGAADEVQVKVWDVHNSRGITTKDMGEVNGPGGVRFSIDGQNLMVISIDGTFQTWDLRSKGGGLSRLVAYFFPNRQGLTVSKSIRVSPSTFVLSPDGRLGIVFPDDNDAALDIWELEDQKQICRLSFRTDLESMTDGSFTADGKRFVSSHYDGKLMIWEIGSQEETELAPAHPGHVLAIYVSPDGSRAITNSWEWENVVWDLTTLSVSDKLPVRGEKSSTVISQNGEKAIDTGKNGVILWDLVRGVRLQPLSSHVATAAVMINDDRIVVSASSEGLLSVWDIETGRQLRTLGGHNAKVNLMLKTTNGKWVITASNDGTAKVWDPEQYREVSNITHGDSITSAAISGDDRWLVTGSTNSIKVWDLQTFAQIDALSTRRRLMDAVITTDGKRVIFYTVGPLGIQGDSLGVWFVGQGDKVRTLVDHNDDVSGIAHMPDGRFVVSISTDNRLNVWDLEEYKTIATFTGGGGLNSCAVTSQGLIIAGEESGWVHFLRLEGSVSKNLGLK